VIVEDDVLVGGNCGVYEGTIVKSRAVLGTGTILNRSTPIYDVVRGKVYTSTETEPLIVPEEAVVVSGSRALPRGVGKDWGISLYTPVIIKYRDAKTDSKIPARRHVALTFPPIHDSSLCVLPVGAMDTWMGAIMSNHVSSEFVRQERRGGSPRCISLPA